MREANKLRRLEWAQKILTDNEQFDIIFTDESTFPAKYHARRVYRRRDEPCLLPKYPDMVHIWGSILKKVLHTCTSYSSNLI